MGTIRTSFPVRHDQDGKTLAASLHPINGKIVFLSIGMSNNTIEFCGGNSFRLRPAGPALPDLLPQPGEQSAAVVHGQGAGLGGAQPGAGDLGRRDGEARPSTGTLHHHQSQGCPVNPTNPWCNYDRVKGDLNAAGLDGSQVQAIWLKNANGYPKCSIGRVYCLPATPAPGGTPRSPSGTSATPCRAIHVRYPNARLVFLSPRTYGSYANVCLNPEPFAYEYGFSLSKKTIVAQIDQIASGRMQSTPPPATSTTTRPPAPSPPLGRLGPLPLGERPEPQQPGALLVRRPGRRPLPRSPGLPRRHRDRSRRLHPPSTSGEQKVANLLLSFLRILYAAWFCATGLLSRATDRDPGRSRSGCGSPGAPRNPPGGAPCNRAAFPRAPGSPSAPAPRTLDCLGVIHLGQAAPLTA